MQPENARHTISPAAMIPDVLRQHPHARMVLDRYGLRGCGGPHGPAETLEYFARAHGVELPQLLMEIEQAVANPASTTGPASERHFLDELADSIYRRFFKAGIAVVLTAGAVWGAYLLLRIGFSGTFRAISIHEINAHGHAQIFGWVGLFVMGFAYQAFPRMKHTSLWRPDLANMSFFLMVFGVFARAIGEPLFALPMFRELAFAAGLAEIAAIGIFIFVLLQTFRHSGKGLAAYDGYIIASMLFFFVQAVYELGLMYAMTAGAPREELIRLIGTYQGPLRDLQVHGFALLMILGVGIRMFPALFGFAAPGAKFVKVSLALLITAVIGEAVFLLIMRETAVPWARWGLLGSMLSLAGISVALTSRWGVFAPAAESQRSAKYVRAAVTWLHVSMAMLVLMPVYMYVLLPNCPGLSESGRHSVEIGFSHAYAGAVRHAITVGFISIMILGMAAKVVPTLNGVDIRTLSALWMPFILINVGCAMRVLFQVATDFGEWAFPIAGVSGLFEVAAIGIWGVHLWRIMNGWRPIESLQMRPDRITADDKVGLVVEWFPQTLPVFLAKGFAPLANPIMRRTVARAISVRQAAQHHSLDVNLLVAELNAAIGAAVNQEGARRSIGLPVLAS
jgi:hypothetical protein